MVGSYFSKDGLLPLHADGCSKGSIVTKQSTTIKRPSEEGQAHCQGSIKRREWMRVLPSVPKPVALVGLLAISTISYLMSLQGGDLVYINNHLSVIGAEVLVSVLSITAITVMLYASRMRNSTRRAALIITTAVFAALYIYDHGERFEKHGFYNLLVFLAIYVPLNIALAAFYLLWCKIDNFLIYLAIAVAVGGASAGVSLLHYRRVFDQGSLDTFKYIPGECEWVGPNIPYIDLLPAGAQNFWAGSMHCKPEKQEIRAHIDSQGILHAQCERKDAAVFVDILPETRTWPLREKDMWNVYNHLVLKRIARLQYTSHQPFRLNETTQAIVVRCDSSSKIVTRVSPPASKLPRYNPPSDSDTRAPDTRNGIAPDRFDASEIMTSDRIRRPNVVFLMLDAVSHRQFYRRLRKSARALKSLHRPGSNRLYELFRYHSVGFSTDNSTKAMYTGEIFPSRPDQLPIWAYYRDRGYITARVESGCEDWAKEYIGNNFRSQDFSVSNRSLDYEFSSPFCLPEFYPNVGNAFGNFKGPYSITARCLYGRYVHDWAFDYLHQLRRELRSATSDESSRRPYMITATFLEGHEGTGEVLRTLDDALAGFIEDMKSSGELDDTVLIIGADHGLHMGLNFAFLQNGRIEHQNPFFALSIPEWLYQFAERYQAEHGSEKVSPFEANEQRLTTPFETHHLFRVLADWPKFERASWDRSLLAAQKAGRICEEAGIGANFCMCKTPQR